MPLNSTPRSRPSDGGEADSQHRHQEWLNPIERWFREITERRIRPGVFKSVAQLEQTISEYIDHHNANLQGFVWTAKTDIILEPFLNNFAGLARHSIMSTSALSAFNLGVAFAGLARHSIMSTSALSAFNLGVANVDNPTKSRPWPNVLRQTLTLTRH